MKLFDWLAVAIIIRTLIKITLWYLEKQDKKNKNF